MLKKYFRVVIPFDIDIPTNHDSPNWVLKQQINKLVIEFAKIYPDMTVKDLVEVGLWFPNDFQDVNK